MPTRSIRSRRCENSPVQVDNRSHSGKDALMNLPRITLSILIVFLLFSLADAQRRRTTSKPATPKPSVAAMSTPTPQPSTGPATNPGAPSIAVVNDLPISAAEWEGDVHGVIM